jgi:hypothetical protein
MDTPHSGVLHASGGCPWIKTIAGGRKLRYIGKQRNRAWFLMVGAVYNILRITALDTAPA